MNAPIEFVVSVQYVKTNEEDKIVNALKHRRRKRSNVFLLTISTAFYPLEYDLI